jgi:AAA+ superfamily predicted ATPase
MARADLLINIVRAAARGEQTNFRRALEALVAEERSKQHHVLADRLAIHLTNNGNSVHSPINSPVRNSQYADLFYEIEPVRRLNDLVLPVEVDNSCKELVEEHHRVDLLRSYNIEPRNRVLFSGPPGNGKTSLAEALAAELVVPLLVVRYESVITSYLGETAVRLARLFELIRARHCVVFLDEFDVVGKERGDVHETGEIKRVVSSLLMQIDALPSYVVVVAATNHAELLDRAVWRRFQLRLNLPRPNADQAQEWFRKFEKRTGLGIGNEIPNLSEQLKGLSYSELEQFGLDVQRKYVLSQPNSDINHIINDKLAQWSSRLNPIKKYGGEE